MQNKKHKCQICGAEYKACNSCDKAHNWKSVVESKKCWLVYLAVTEHRLGITNEAEFISALSKAGINRHNLESQNFIEPVMATIREVLNRGQANKKAAQQPFRAEKLSAKSETPAEAEVTDK